MVDGSTSDSGSGDAQASEGDNARSSTNGASGKKEASSASAASSKTGTQNTAEEKELLNGMPKDKYMSFKPQSPERVKASPMEVIVDHGVERAIKVLKRKLIKDGLFKELKSRRYYSKPSEEKKRKLKESLKKIRKEEARRQKAQLMF